MNEELALMGQIIQFLPISDRLDDAVDGGTGVVLSPEETKVVGELIGSLMDRLGEFYMESAV